LSIQEDVNYIKKALSGDEKVLESAFKLETIYKKHKLKIGIALLAIIVFFAGKSIEQNMQQSALLEANTAFLTLQNTPSDSNALKILQEKNPALFELFSYKEAVKNQDSQALKALSSSKSSIISDVSSYQASIVNKKPSNSVLYNDMALLTQGYLALNSGNSKVALLKFSQIDEHSSLAKIRGLLKHSTLKVQ